MDWSCARSAAILLLHYLVVAAAAAAARVLVDDKIVIVGSQLCSTRHTGDCIRFVLGNYMHPRIGQKEQRTLSHFQMKHTTIIKRS